jgi:hypothetical protein
MHNSIDTNPFEFISSFGLFINWMITNIYYKPNEHMIVAYST